MPINHSSIILHIHIHVQILVHVHELQVTRWVGRVLVHKSLIPILKARHLHVHVIKWLWLCYYTCVHVHVDIVGCLPLRFGISTQEIEPPSQELAKHVYVHVHVHYLYSLHILYLG